MKAPVFRGTCTAIVTPFHESGFIDYEALKRLLDRQLEAGIDAICVCGTTGESATLTEGEHLDLIAFCVCHVAGRVPVIAGCGSNDTAGAVLRSRYAEKAGADALLHVTPYYNKTTQEGLRRHFLAVADATDLPVILYNVPSRTGLSCTPETYRALADHPNVVGVKEASGDLGLVTRTLRSCPEDFTVWSGNDDQVVPMMALGAQGVISVCSNVLPARMTELSHLCLDGDYAAAGALQLELSELIDALFLETNPIPVKTALGMLGVCADTLRLPLCPMGTANRETLYGVLHRLGLTA